MRQPVLLLSSGYFKAFGLMLAIMFIQCNVFAQFYSTWATITGPSANVCPGVLYTYNLSHGGSGGSSCSASWSASGGTIFNRSNTFAQVIWNNASSGSLSVQVGSSDSQSCPYASDNNPVTIRYLAPPTFNPSTLFIPCTAGSRTITATAVTGATEYRWTLPNGFSPTTAVTTTNSLSISYNATVSGNITVRAFNGNCGNESSAATLVVTRQPSAPTLNNFTELCHGENLTITATPPAGVPTNYGYNWHASSGVLINGQATSSSSPLFTTSNSVTISAGSGTFGNATVSVRLNNNNCPPSLYQVRTFQVSTFNNQQFYIFGPSNACPNQAVYFSALSNPGGNAFQSNGILEYQWTWPSDWSYMGGQNTPYLDLRTPFGTFNGGVVTLRVRNRCGWTGSAATRFVSAGFSCSGGFSLATFPNPSSDYIDVSLESESGTDDITQESTTPIPEFEARIYDQYSQLRKSAKSKEGKTRIPVKDLPKGTYYLHAIFGNEVIRKQIVVQ